MSEPKTPTPEICEGCWFLLANGRVFPGCTHCSTLAKYRSDIAARMIAQEHAAPPREAGKEKS